MRKLRERQQAGGDTTAGAADREGHTDTDLITGLPSRVRLMAALQEAVHASHQQSNLAVLTFIEAGELRDINDVLGPDEGDELLRQVAARLRTIDLPGTQVFRYEGAAFAAIFPNVPNVGGADTVAEFLVDLLSAPFELGTTHAGMGPVVGAAVSADNYESLDDMVRDGFHALVQARERGPGAFVVHDESRRTRFSTRIDDRRLHDAITDNEFALYYQPIMSMTTGKVAGAEALIRWLQPGATNIGVLFPHDFLPLLEMSDPGLGDAVAAALAAHGVAPSQLTLDITEDALRHNEYQRDTVWARLRAVRDMGVKLALDEFGRGMASLSVLRQIRFDILRIDRLFVSGLGLADEDRILIKHVTALAHDLGCQTIAEGVETPEQAALLRELGVDFGQGFHYGRPEKAAAFADLLRS